ncbi:MAG: bifunctional [glutamine synthetase] adenylyltransferase/[glutamine synthetase]-adenylyl-L-tyrosine phosphorylase [Pseudoclavibacter sp.]|nr:bifunctional [glutamine synthetase] adenylyltransferase/[glutamine synthetase]-adenylyl-L-tyrosine phosphorylase [Pseudoclavibacter sp.]
MARDETRTTLARLGFAAPSAAAQRIEELSGLCETDPALLTVPFRERIADPDLALEQLVRIARADARAASDILAEPGLLRTAVRLLGASAGFGPFFQRHPQALAEVHAGHEVLPGAEELRAGLLDAVGAERPREGGPLRARLSGHRARSALRRRYRVELARIAAHDLSRPEPLAALPETAHVLAGLAAAALEAALAVARADLSSPPAGFGRFPAEQVDAVRLAIVGMGKAGAEELNYLSDVDVVFVAEAVDTADAVEGPQPPGPRPPESARSGPRGAAPGGLPAPRMLEIAGRLAAASMRVIDEPGVEPALWEVDANLRPEGKDGPLVRTPESYLAYYRRWARDWEFQALLKARCMAGDRELGERLCEQLAPLVWRGAERTGFVEQVRAMRERVTAHIPAGEVERQIKLGPGGLRDIEFTVQLLQLAHGQGDPALRVRGTLAALDRLVDGGYIGREDAARFSEDYRFLRLLEHRLQLRGLRRTHLMPSDPDEQRALARSTGFETAEALLAAWRETKVRVRGLHEKVFYRPLLSAVAAIPAERFQLTSEQAVARLGAIGYRDPKGALGHISALIRGVSRRAQMQRTLLPLLLDWFAQGSDPDRGLLAFRRLSEQLGETPWYLRLLRDSSAAARRLCRLLSDSGFAAGFLELHPEAVKWLDDDALLRPRPLPELQQEIDGTLRRHASEEGFARALRTFRRREVLRMAIGALLRVNGTEELGRSLADIATAVLAGAETAVRRADGPDAHPPFAIVAMGRYGGRELGFGSDLDVMYVYDGEGRDPKAAAEGARRLVQRITELVADPRLPLELDADLRPEGRAGPLVRSLDAYRTYYEKWSLGWEAQALLRADPVVGDPGLRERFTRLVDGVRYPAGLDEAGLREIRRIKARVESERLPRGADPRRHLKLGRGSLSDVEWLVQTLQLQHAHEAAGLRTTSTLGALAAAEELGLLTAEEARILREAWTTATRVRSAVSLFGERQSDVLPEDAARLAGIARLLGYPEGGAQRLEDDYLAVTRRARRVFERCFYGERDEPGRAPVADSGER